MITIDSEEPIQRFCENIFVLTEELSPAVSAKTNVIVKLISPREVSIRCEEHVMRILRLLSEKEGNSTAALG